MSAGGEKMRPLVSTVNGTVREIIYENADGNRLVIQDDEGWFYVYLHLNNDTPGTDDSQATRDQVFAPGLEVGQRVKQCQVIAYVGDSGNAESAGPHLHFEIRRPVDNTSSWAWSSATPINPNDSLHAAAMPPAAAPPPSESSSNLPRSSIYGGRWAPFSSVTGLVERQYRRRLRTRPRRPRRAVLGRPAQQRRRHPGLVHRAAPGGAGARSPHRSGRSPLLGVLRSDPRHRGLAALGRARPHGHHPRRGVPGLRGERRVPSVYGSFSDADFVRLVYRNVLDREPDAAGEEHWTGQLADGASTRGAVMAGFSESPEYRIGLASSVQVVLTYVAMLERSPDAGDLVQGMTRGASAARCRHLLERRVPGTDRFAPGLSAATRRRQLAISSRRARSIAHGRRTAVSRHSAMRAVVSRSLGWNPRRWYSKSWRTAAGVANGDWRSRHSPRRTRGRLAPCVGIHGERDRRPDGGLEDEGHVGEPHRDDAHPLRAPDTLVDVEGHRLVLGLLEGVPHQEVADAVVTDLGAGLRIGQQRARRASRCSARARP